MTAFKTGYSEVKTRGYKDPGLQRGGGEVTEFQIKREALDALRAGPKDPAVEARERERAERQARKEARERAHAVLREKLAAPRREAEAREAALETAILRDAEAEKVLARLDAAVGSADLEGILGRIEKMREALRDLETRAREGEALLADRREAMAVKTDALRGVHAAFVASREAWQRLPRRVRKEKMDKKLVREAEQRLGILRPLRTGSGK